MPARTASLMLNLFDGARQPLAPSLPLLVRLINGAGRLVCALRRRGPSIYFSGLPFENSFADDYTVVVSARGHSTAAFTPVRLTPQRLATLDLMLLPRHGSFHFHAAQWRELERTRPHWISRLDRLRYERLMENQPAALAGLLNLFTALEHTPLGEARALDFVVELMWDPQPAPDRCFVWARCELLDLVRQAAARRSFVPTVLPSLFHPGATASFKEIRFPFANLQLTFHEKDRRRIGGRECLKLEPDLDYYRDPAAHALLEVLPNTLLGRVTDPRMIYWLRWMVTRRAGTEEFAPPYTVG